MVLLDFGLCVELEENFKKQYCLLWKSIFDHDVKTINEICRSWGISDPDMFVTGQTMKPFTKDKGIKHKFTKQEQ